MGVACSSSLTCGSMASSWSCYLALSWLSSLPVSSTPCTRWMTRETRCTSSSWCQCPQAEEKSAALRRGPSQHSYNEGEKKPILRGMRNTDRTTRLLVVILGLFIIAEFPQVSFPPSCTRVTFSYPGDSWPSLSSFWETVFPRVLQSIGWGHGHDGPHQQLSQLHPLLPHVNTVQKDPEQYFCQDNSSSNIFNAAVNTKSRGKIKYNKS